jgi:hypothetical protein
MSYLDDFKPVTVSTYCTIKECDETLEETFALLDYETDTLHFQCPKCGAEQTHKDWMANL